VSADPPLCRSRSLPKAATPSLLVLSEAEGGGCAHSSNEAYAALSSGGFAAVVLDWNLSNSHRGEATAKGILKKYKELYPHLPVIVVSGFADVDVRNDALHNGADSFLAKPFGLELLITHVKRWTERVAAVDESLWPTNITNVRPLDEVQRRYVLRVLSLTGENVSRAAEVLKIHRHTVASIKATRKERG
jgi:DNA-binding NtrC family response regulator